MEDRQTRADRWSEGTHSRISTVEPEWWLRMMCGQLADEDTPARYAGLRGALRRAEIHVLSVVFGNSRRTS
jgi:hypothetical protein